MQAGVFSLFFSRMLACLAAAAAWSYEDLDWGSAESNATRRRGRRTATCLQWDPARHIKVRMPCSLRNWRAAAAVVNGSGVAPARPHTPLPGGSALPRGQPSMTAHSPSATAVASSARRRLPPLLRLPPPSPPVRNCSRTLPSVALHPFYDPGSLPVPGHSPMPQKTTQQERRTRPHRTAAAPPHHRTASPPPTLPHPSHSCRTAAPYIYMPWTVC